jgi:phosphoserine aminotransferase
MGGAATILRMGRIYNFAAGPGPLPDAVRARLAEQLAPSLDGTPSPLEVSHRGPQFAAVAEALHDGLRAALRLTDTHELLLMPGGAQFQFALLPMNLAAGRPVAYIESGYWSRMAMEQARAVADVRVVASGASTRFTDLPVLGEVPADAAYLHYCGNETIHGLQYAEPPQADVPLVADLSSEILSRPYPIERLGVAYACAQKNLGIAGLTVLVIRRDLLEGAPTGLPSMLDYRAWAASSSMQNTPCGAAWLAVVEMLAWLQREGGVEEMARRNAAKAAALYACLDRHECYLNPVAPRARSQMNAVFRLADQEREADFLRQAAAAGLVGLDGHRAVGGMRVSMYNAVPMTAVTTLIEFLDDYAARW